jgi:hypothetical protein
MALLDPESVQVLRQNRSKLSRDITDVINEYGPQAFPDFDGKFSWWKVMMYQYLILFCVCVL